MDELSDGATVYYPIDSEGMSEEEKGEVIKKGYTGDSPPGGDTAGEEKPEPEKKPKKSLADLKKELLWVWGQIDQTVRLYEFDEGAKGMSVLVYLAVLACFVMAPLFLLARKFDHAFMLVSVAVYEILMMFLLSSSAFGLPQLMDVSRSSVYLAYAIPLVWVVALDGKIGRAHV